jgi:hypothetical protein
MRMYARMYRERKQCPLLRSSLNESLNMSLLLVLMFQASNEPTLALREHTWAYVSIREHTWAYVSIYEQTSAYVSIRQHTSAFQASNDPTPQSAYVSIRQHTSAFQALLVYSTGLGSAMNSHLQTYADGMLTYADVVYWYTTLVHRTGLGSAMTCFRSAYVCWRMLTCADVCWRMLTYADIHSLSI